MKDNTLLLVILVVLFISSLMFGLAGCQGDGPAAPVYDPPAVVDSEHVSIALPAGWSVDTEGPASVITVDSTDYLVSDGLLRVEMRGPVSTFWGTIYLLTQDTSCALVAQYTGVVPVQIDNTRWRVDIAPLRVLEGDTARPVRSTCGE